MFQSTKPCLCKETNGSYSNAVMGILIITITVSVGLSVLGVWVNVFDGSQEDTFDLPLIPEKKSVEDIISQEISSEVFISEDQSSEDSGGAFLGLCDEPVPESGYVGQFDTVPGTLTIISENLPTEPLPLCIDNAYLADFSIVVESIGGYSPVWGAIFVNQLKGDECFEGIINANFAEILGPEECPDIVYYEITFTVDEPFGLDSNHLPVGFDQSVILDKWVEVCFATEWKGCELDTQKFMVILAHKAMSQNPKLPIYYTSPV